MSTRVKDHDAGRRPAGEIAERAWTWFVDLDRRVVRVLRGVSLLALRGSVAVVFIWFGALKVAGASPVVDLVAGVVPWADPDWFVPALGVVEVAVGLGLLLGRALRAVLALYAVQLLGTFGVLALQPEVAFQDGNPLLLTTEGEFVIKNLVLLSVGLAVGAALRSPRPWSAPPER